MFTSFFPKPKLFFLSAVIWTAISVGLWYGGGDAVGRFVGLPLSPPGAEPVQGLAYFWTDEFLWFYIYSLAFIGFFCAAWMRFCPHPWQWWSVIGTAALLYTEYLQVQVSVAINNWRRPFGDLIQAAVSHSHPVSGGDFYSLFALFAALAFPATMLYVVSNFFVSHYVFRWRTAMNDHYMARWEQVRGIEGASQRVQEDTMRFATIIETLGVSMIDSIMTLFAFLPVLAYLSKDITTLPIVGDIPYPLVLAAIFWSAFGTLLLWVAGIRLPGLAFHNQRTEAAYRKELVYGEDDATRAAPPTVAQLYGNVRRSYFRYYFHFAYFNIFRQGYFQADSLFSVALLVPSLVAGKITLGIMNRISDAFGQVSGSFQFLVASWPTIIELMSIHKRLIAFERAFEGRDLPPIEEEPDPPANA